MGYYTNFTISLIEGDKEQYEQMLKELAEKTDYPEIEDEFFNAKWYDCEKDCTEISKKYPDILFQVDGDGEETPDFWSYRFKAGVSEYVECKIEKPEFKLLATHEECDNAWKLVVIDLTLSILYTIPLSSDEYQLSVENEAAFMQFVSDTYGINLDKFSWGIVNQFSTLKKKST